MQIGTLTFAFQLLRRVESDFVPNTGITIAGALMSTGLLLFIFFLDRSIKRMRPVAVAALVARAGRKAFEDAVHAAGEPDAPDVLPGGWAPASEATFVVRSDRAGAVQAIDSRGLVRWARKHECLLVLQHVVGDFVSTGAPLIEIHGGTDDPGRAERQLRGMVALGVERTIEQDPAFAVRVMVDIANKALSAAINDPTTAVQVIDHLGETLHLIGTTDLAGLSAQRGPEHVRRVIVPTRRWEEFLALGVTEIRQYGGSAIQVVRRLHAMLEELEDAVRPEHRAAVADELARLQKTVEVRFADSAAPRPRAHGRPPGDRRSDGGLNAAATAGGRPWPRSSGAGSRTAHDRDQLADGPLLDEVLTPLHSQRDAHRLSAADDRPHDLRLHLGSWSGRSIRMTSPISRRWTAKSIAIGRL